MLLIFTSPSLTLFTGSTTAFIIIVATGVIVVVIVQTLLSQNLSKELWTSKTFWK